MELNSAVRKVLGAFIGDMLGSPYEGGFGATGQEELLSANCKFTDDSVLTAAVGDWCLHGGDLHDILQSYWRRFPNRGYCDRFSAWAQFRTREPYQSWGNGR